jgi:hypothetical protein
MKIFGCDLSKFYAEDCIALLFQMVNDKCNRKGIVCFMKRLNVNSPVLRAFWFRFSCRVLS